MPGTRSRGKWHVINLGGRQFTHGPLCTYTLYTPTPPFPKNGVSRATSVDLSRRASTKNAVSLNGNRQKALFTMPLVSIEPARARGETCKIYLTPEAAFYRKVDERTF